MPNINECLSESQVTSIINALFIAVKVYGDDESHSLQAHDRRLADQFARQAMVARETAALIEEAVQLRVVL